MVDQEFNMIKWGALAGPTYLYYRHEDTIECDINL